MRVESDLSQETETALQRLSDLAAFVTTADGLTTAVSITEARLDDIIDDLVAAKNESSSIFGTFLIARSSSTFKQSWANRFELLSRGLEINVPDVQLQNIKLVLDIRNALAHGEGRLTAYQTQRWASAIELRRSLRRSMHVTSSGRNLRIGPDTVRIGVEALSDYLKTVDLQAQMITRQ